MLDPLLTTAESAEYLSTSIRTIDRWIAAGRLTPQFVGRRKRFRTSALDALVTTAVPVRPMTFGHALAAE
jgi:excisionase family DNA binding protein